MCLDRKSVLIDGREGLLNLRTVISDGSLVGVRIASTKTNGPHDRGQGAAHDEENRGSAANASGEWSERGAGALGGADARRDDDHAPGLPRLGPCAGAGRPGRGLSR